jgi:hypothetical protein
VCIGSIEVKRYRLRNLRHRVAWAFDVQETSAGRVFPLATPLVTVLQILRAAFNEMR